MQSYRSASFLVLGALLVLSSLARGQSGDRISGSPTFGTASTVQSHIGFTDFLPATSSTNYALVTSTSRTGFYSTAFNSFYAIAHIPTGAHLTSFELDFCDTDAINHVELNLFDCDSFGGNCAILATPISAVPPGGTGCGSISRDLTGLNYTMENHSHELVLAATLKSGTNTNVLLGAYVGYQLQVSPGPATATFSDVPTNNPQFKFVEALVAAGITAGCGNGNYCPTAPVTRGQMAVFLATALGLHFPD